MFTTLPALPSSGSGEVCTTLNNQFQFLLDCFSEKGKKYVISGEKKKVLSQALYSEIAYCRKLKSEVRKSRW